MPNWCCDLQTIATKAGQQFLENELPQGLTILGGLLPHLKRFAKKHFSESSKVKKEQASAAPASSATGTGDLGGKKPQWTVEQMTNLIQSTVFVAADARANSSAQALLETLVTGGADQVNMCINTGVRCPVPVWGLGYGDSIC